MCGGTLLIISVSWCRKPVRDEGLFDSSLLSLHRCVGGGGSVASGVFKEQH